MIRPEPGLSAEVQEYDLLVIRVEGKKRKQTKEGDAGRRWRTTRAGTCRGRRGGSLRDHHDGQRERHGQRPKHQAATLPDERRQRRARLVAGKPFVVASHWLMGVHAVPLSCIHPLGLA